MKQAALKKHTSAIQDRVDSIDWNCEDADTKYITHGIHRYSGKFIPQIARQALEIVSAPGQTILDPYCGSGTTLLEAAILKRRAIGMDMNPLAVLIAKVKCTPISIHALVSIQQELVGYARLLEERQKEPNLFSSAELTTIHKRVEKDPRWQHEWYRKWFDESGLWQLIALHQEIVSIPDEDLRSIGLIAFSDILRRCSHARGGYPNVMYDKRRLPRPLPASLFLNRLHDVCKCVKALSDQPMDWRPTVSAGDARNTKLDDESVDAIVTHPPYIGSVPYAEYGVLSLTWFGYDAKELDRKLTGGRRQSPDVIDRFMDGYREMLKEAWRVLKHRGICFVMVGNPLIKGERVSLRNMTLELAPPVGFEVVAQAKRIGVNRRANLMGEEHLLFLEKQ